MKYIGITTRFISFFGIQSQKSDIVKYIDSASRQNGMIQLVYIANPNTETIQYKLLFSHLTVQHPSVALSQKQELAVCNPAPDFCIIVQFTIYLNGFCSPVSPKRHPSTTAEVHWLTLVLQYVWPPITCSIVSLTMPLTSSATNWVSSLNSSMAVIFLE